MIREPDTMGAATWLISAAAATLILILIWLLSTVLHPSVWLWLLDAGPMTPLALLALGLLLTGVPR